MYQLQTLIEQSNVLHRELLREMANYNYEITPNGILFARAGLHVGGVMGNEVRRLKPKARQALARGQRRRFPMSEYVSLGRHEDHNLVPTEGLNRLVTNWLAAGAQIANVYVSIFQGDYTPISSVDAAGYPTDANEVTTSYDETTRPAFTPGVVASGSVDNTSSRATFTMNSSITVYGGGMHTTSAKASTVAPLMAVVRFSASRDVTPSDKIDVDYTFTANDT